MLDLSRYPESIDDVTRLRYAYVALRREAITLDAEGIRKEVCGRLYARCLW